MRKYLGAKPLSYAQPVLIIAAYDEGGVPCAMNAAWGGISEEKQIAMCLSAGHKTVKDILERKAFTVAMGTADMVKECDYVGIESGNKAPDKLARAGLHTTKSEHVDAPLIDELPVALECRLISYDPDSCIMLGEIVDVAVDEAYLTADGKVDTDRVRPITLDPFNGVYRVIGEVAGRAFHDGLELKK